MQWGEASGGSMDVNKNLCCGGYTAGSPNIQNNSIYYLILHQQEMLVDFGDVDKGGMFNGGMCNSTTRGIGWWSNPSSPNHE